MRKLVHLLAPFTGVVALAQEAAEKAQKKGVPAWVWIIVVVVVLIVVYLLYKRLTGKKEQKS